MASLALGVAGAAIGSMFGPLGAQVGWVLGAAVGNMLDPQKGPAGPRLNDLKLHNSSYGGITPLLWGMMRVAGNVIEEQPEYTEHESGGGGGKGGPEAGPTYTYTCSFAVRLCEGPIKGIRRIWANGRLIYDHSGSSALHDDLPLTIYLGTEEQLPDPTLEMLHGAGNVPAYRGIAYVVFTDLLLTEFGNALPNLNFEVYTSRVGDIPIRISTFDPTNVSGVVTGVTYDPATEVITVADYTTAARKVRHFLLDGTPTGVDVDQVVTPYYLLTSRIANLDVASIAVDPSNAYWFVEGVMSSLITGTWPTPIGTLGVYLNDFIYTPGNNIIGSASGILRFPAPGGIPAGGSDLFALVSGSGGNFHLNIGDNDKIYMFDAGSGNVYEFESDLTLTHTWLPADFPALGTGNFGGGGFFRFNDFFATNFGGFSFNRMNLIGINPDDSLYLYDQPRTGATPDFNWTGGQIVQLAGGYVLGKDGVALLEPPISPVHLSEIVADLSGSAGLDASQYDVESLTDLVDGYLVEQQATARDMIQPLRDGYFFDAVERDAAVVFVKRGGESVVTIPDDELAAHGDGDAVPPIVGTVRAQEVDLPCAVNIDYVNAAADYQTGTQAARRQVTQSESEVSLNLPINMSDAKAKAVADVQLYTAWVERNRFTVFTSRKYAAYEPTDVITVNARQLRVVEKNETRPGVIKWDGVESLEQAMIQAGGSVATEFVPSPPGGVTITGDTIAYLLDLPLVSDSDNPDGFYAAMTWETGGGAGLYKSADGVTYASVASTTVRAVMGTASSTLGDFTGGNQVDQGNWLDVVLLNGELTSTTAANLLNGANLAVVGDEVFQFQLAELTDVDTYRLTGLLRGRLGTEFAIATHDADEEFALLPTLRVQQDFAELYTSRSFKPVTFGQALADADAQSFTNTGAAWRPYAPVLLGGGTDDVGDVELHWTRRTRLGGGAWLSVDVPLGESAEVYVVLIWNEDYSLCARQIVTGAFTSITYTAADQVSDFGATQETIFFSVSQVGSAGFGTQARGLAPGAGASNVDPLAPITPPGA